MARKIWDHLDFAHGRKRVYFDENGDAAYITTNLSNSDDALWEFITKYITIPLILIAAIYFGGGYYVSTKMPDFLMPTYKRVSSEGLFRDGIRYNHENFAKEYMLKNQIESWKQFGLFEGFSEGKKNRLEFECDVDFFDYVSSDICNKLDLMKFDLWYKTDEYSVIQSIICVDTDFYKGKQLKDSEGKDLRLTQYFLVRSKMTAEKGTLFVTYKFEPEHIEMVYSNYDLDKLAEYIQYGNKPNDLIRKN